MNYIKYVYFVSLSIKFKNAHMLLNINEIKILFQNMPLGKD